MKDWPLHSSPFFFNSKLLLVSKVNAIFSHSNDSSPTVEDVTAHVLKKKQKKNNTLPLTPDFFIFKRVNK